jgi:hypothetical protein
VRKAILAAAAAAALAVGAQADTIPAEPTSLTRVVGWIVTIGGGIKAIVEFYDWVVARWYQPSLNPADLWLCQTCGFTPEGGTPTGDDHAMGAAFIASAFPGRPWHHGQSVIVCDGATCLKFTWQDGMFVPSGNTFADPRVGHANKPTAPSTNSPSNPGGGETGAPHAPRSSTVWAPNVVYNPGSRPFPAGTVTVIPGPGVTFGGGGGGGSHFIGPLPQD